MHNCFPSSIHSKYDSFFEQFISYLLNRLLNQKGSLLAYAGSEDKDVKVTAAVASNIWTAYEKSGKVAFHNEGLRFMFLNCEVRISQNRNFLKLFWILSGLISCECCIFFFGWQNYIDLVLV